jgi:ELWxxDGT repeat protein
MDQGHYVYYRTNGTTNGTFASLLYSETNSTFYPFSSVVFNNELLYQSETINEGFELWQTDGSSSSIVSDICPGSCRGWPQNLFNAGNMVLFAANDGTHGYELWKIDSTMTNIHEPAIEAHITIYPNPSNGLINIKADSERISKAKIYNIEGQELLTDELGLSQTIQVSGFATGIYFIRLFDGKGNCLGTAKFVKD